ncbi:hypothetical protein Rhe02_63290 [Rhizocola hellebori]|uniref:Uncharacterized protein n=2 Tax=Rhizocola hellebori TaxID=1392758 RepID=A0A8J3VJB6_9ACTN|nr:hypothetical protein Rhe02_63290 [Rhizocola hellebori]
MVGTSNPAQAAPTGPDAAATPLAAGAVSPTVRLATTEQILAMAARGNGKLMTLGAPDAKAGKAASGSAIAAVNCYLDFTAPYGGGAAGAHIYVDGFVFCDAYIHLGVLTVELYRGADRVANRTVTTAYVPVLYGTAETSTCNAGVYTGVVGATLARYDLTPPSVSLTIVTYPVYIGCGPSTPPATPLAVTNPGNLQGIELVYGTLQMTATGGTAPYTWSATGLPTGLSINSSTGLISGTARAGIYATTVTAVDATGATSSAQFQWTIFRDRCPRC